MPSRDVFICHADADKIAYVTPLEAELNSVGVSCWVDKGQIRPGDSIVRKINTGLSLCRYSLVLMTERFLTRNWTKKELDSAIARETRTGDVHVIPIPCADVQVCLDRYPLLEDKSYLVWTDGVGVIAQKVGALFSRVPNADWHCDHPEEYVGQVWVRVMPAVKNLHTEHMITLRWGPYVRRHLFVPTAAHPISLVHHKVAADAVTLNISILPPAVVTFGQGRAPDTTYVNVDEGWTRGRGES